MKEADSLAYRLAILQIRYDYFQFYMVEFNRIDSQITKISGQYNKYLTVLEDYVSKYSVELNGNSGSCAQLYKYRDLITFPEAEYILAVTNMGNVFFVNGFNSRDFAALAEYLYGKIETKEDARRMVALYSIVFGNEYKSVYVSKSGNDTSNFVVTATFNESGGSHCFYISDGRFDSVAICEEQLDE